MGSVYDLLSSAGSNAPKEYDFSVQGDLCQMGAQKEFLQKRGFDLRQSDVYPVLKEEDKKDALEAIWNARVEGWWHYKETMVKLGICTAEDWDTALNVQCGKDPKAKGQSEYKKKKKEEDINATPKIDRKLRF